MVAAEQADETVDPGRDLRLPAVAEHRTVFAVIGDDALDVVGAERDHRDIDLLGADLLGGMRLDIEPLVAREAGCRLTVFDDLEARARQLPLQPRPNAIAVRIAEHRDTHRTALAQGGDQLLLRHRSA